VQAAGSARDDAGVGAGLLDAVRDVPVHTPTARELADLELLLDGAYPPLTGFLRAADAARVEAEGRLADGTPWPVPVTLALPTGLEDGRLVLADPEGTPLALLEVATGKVRRLRSPEHGAARRARRTPAAVRAALPPGPVLAAVTARPPYRPVLDALARAAADLGDATVLLLVPVLEPGPDGLAPETLVRTVLAAAETLPGEPVVVAVPLPAGGDPDREALRRAHVAQAYGATHLLTEVADERPPGSRGTPLGPGGAPLGPGDGPLPLVAGPAADGTADRVAHMIDRGERLPEDLVTPAVARVLQAARPPRARRGLVVLLTGLSGSGKSTVARGLVDALQEHGGRLVTLLDGDVVRRMLSAGLGFGRADRDLNVRRIGWVAAEIARHGGLVVCAPIAPYAATRADVRAMAADASADFVLVHVATPLEVCERRDRKGLYAKARAGLIPAFTGVSDPYEAPTDADLVLDTSEATVEEAVRVLLDRLVAGGWVTLPR